MVITNKDLDDKLDKIHTRINGLLERTTQLVEHVKMQNGRIEKCEKNINGFDGVMREHEAEINESHGITKAIKIALGEHLRMHRDLERRGWDRQLAKFGGMVSIGTGLTIGVILLLAQHFLGI